MWHGEAHLVAGQRTGISVWASTTTLRLLTVYAVVHQEDEPASTGVRSGVLERPTTSWTSDSFVRRRDAAYPQFGVLLQRARRADGSLRTVMDITEARHARRSARGCSVVHDGRKTTSPLVAREMHDQFGQQLDGTGLKPRR